MRALREEGIVIGQLERACVYEFKVRPFFDEFQGTDSEVKAARTLEEGMSTLDPCCVCHQRTNIFHQLAAFHFTMHLSITPFPAAFVRLCRPDDGYQRGQRHVLPHF